MMSSFTVDDICSILEIDAKEINDYLQIFEDAGIIKKVSGSEYIYLPEKTPKKNYKKQNKSITDKELNDLKPLVIDITKDKHYEIYLNAPEWAKRKADKYLALIQAAGGLRGDKLKFFAKQWSRMFPQLKTSAASIARARKSFREEGLTGLLANYHPHNSGQYKINNELYQMFKELYLTYEAIPMTTAINLTREKFISLRPDLNGYTLPSNSAFKRRLEKEFTIDEVRCFRTLNIKGAKLN